MRTQCIRAEKVRDVHTVLKDIIKTLLFAVYGEH